MCLGTSDRFSEGGKPVYSIGIDIGGTNIAAGLLDGTRKLVRKRSRPFPGANEPKQSVRVMAELITTLLDEQGIGAGDVAGVGLAVPGSIDYKKNLVIDAYNLGYHGFPLVDEVKAYFPELDVSIENDANAAALAEYYCGAFRGYGTGLLITLGTGVGGGLVLDHKLFVGGRQNGFEYGHMTLVYGGEPCTCGHRGCVEAYCSATALIREGRRAAASHPDSLIAVRAGANASGIDAKLVIDCAKAGDPEARRIFDAYTSHLGAAVSSAVAVLDPEIIAFGGGVSNAGEFLLEPVRAYARQYAFFKQHAKIVPAEMGNDAGIVGAALLHLQRGC